MIFSEMPPVGSVPHDWPIVHTKCIDRVLRAVVRAALSHRVCGPGHAVGAAHAVSAQSPSDDPRPRDCKDLGRTTDGSWSRACSGRWSNRRQRAPRRALERRDDLRCDLDEPREDEPPDADLDDRNVVRGAGLVDTVDECLPSAARRSRQRRPREVARHLSCPANRAR